MKYQEIGKVRFCILLSIVALLFGCSTTSKTLSVKPTGLDFGQVNIDDTVDKEITIKNKYGKEVQLNSIVLSGSNDFVITDGGVVPVLLDKNVEHIIKISYMPTTAGEAESILEIEHDASAKAKTVQIAGIGVPVPRIEILETTYDFDKKIINKAHTHDFVIENKGSDLLNVSAMTFTGTGSSAYSITAGNAPFDVQIGTTHTFTVTFNPTAVGTYPVELAISHNAVNGSNPAKITIDGEGVDVDPRITLSVGSSWDFGTVTSITPSTEVCEIENTGIDPLTVSNVVLTSGINFIISGLEDPNGNPLNFPQTIQVGDKILMSVLFSPTASANYNDTLTFTHDGTNEISPWDVPVTGVGVLVTEKTFTYTGAVQNWTVPVGVTSIQVECYGAQGGESQGGTGLYGKGGMAAATVPVTPGSTVYVYVGGKGTTIQVSATGGWNGGGGTNCTYTSIFPGSGGGASDIRIGGTDFADRKLVGAGGGGGGYASYGAKGGDGGGMTGQGGTGGSHYIDATGGTQTAGGSAGASTSGKKADPGLFGLGGRGVGNSAGGGGGGGGWYGGGGGCLNSGAGGSSYYDANGNTNKSTQTGVHTGDGKVKIKY